jgi:hypothetical protein
MDLNQLIGLLNRVYVWLPQDNPMRQEVMQVLNQLKAQRQ